MAPRQEVHRLSQLLREKSRAVEELSAELDATGHQLEEERSATAAKEEFIRQLQTENRSLVAQAEELGKFGQLLGSFGK